MRRYISSFTAILFFLQFCIPCPVDAFTAREEIKEAKLKDWLASNGIKLIARETPKSTVWDFSLVFPSAEDDKLEWNIWLHLNQHGVQVAEAVIKPGIIGSPEAKQSLAFWFKVAKDFTDESQIIVYKDEKKPSRFPSGPAAMYVIKLKDLCALGGHSNTSPK